ncbi:MAG: LapA family protein [Pseudomonadota bacterium]|nr:LapA family protein [Pseudomonadota bacterium]
MEPMKKITALLFSFVCIALSLWVVAHNLNHTTLSLGFMSFSQPQWVWMLASAFVGFLLTALAFQARVLHLKFQMRQLRKKLLLQGKVAPRNEESLGDESPRLSKLNKLKN